MKRIGFFKRIGRPTQMGNLFVKTGDVIKADFDFIMEQREGGWLYINPKQQPQLQPKPHPTVQVVPKFEPEVIKTEPLSHASIEEVDAVKDITNLYESIESKRKEEWDKANPPPASMEVNIDKLKELKKLSNKEWFSVTKEQCVKLLTEAHIDFSHVQNTKWELIKFIKGIIKDL